MEGDSERVVGADRVLAVLVELAAHPAGVSLDELAQQLGSPKSTVHRALGSLQRAKLALRTGRGRYRLGDEFLRLASLNAAGRPETQRIEPVLEALAERFGETVHYAVLDGRDVVYRAKVDPVEGAVRLTSFVGGRNPAHCTAVGKLLLSRTVDSLDALRALLGEGPLERRTDRTITELPALWDELEATRERGFGTDDQENETGVNCVAVPVGFIPEGAAAGAVSVSGLAFRTSLSELEAAAPSILAAVRETA